MGFRLRRSGHGRCGRRARRLGPASQTGAFVDPLRAVTSDAELEQFVVRHGVRRTDPRFWATSDWLPQNARRANVTEAGLHDLGRYENP